MTFAIFHDFPGLENRLPKFHDFPWPGGTLSSSSGGSSTSMWCRSVVKYGGQVQSGQVIKLFQITPYVNDFQILKQFWAKFMVL